MHDLSRDTPAFLRPGTLDESCPPQHDKHGTGDVLSWDKYMCSPVYTDDHSRNASWKADRVPSVASLSRRRVSHSLLPNTRPDDEVQRGLRKPGQQQHCTPDTIIPVYRPSGDRDRQTGDGWHCLCRLHAGAFRKQHRHHSVSAEVPRTVPRKVRSVDSGGCNLFALSCPYVNYNTGTQDMQIGHTGTNVLAHKG